MHVHSCHHKERIFKFEWLSAKVKYCYLCFDWIVEKNWNKYCQSYLQYLTSMQCNSFIYCSTLIQSTFCSFCISNNKLDTLRKLNSWIRNHQLGNHLEAHLRETFWLKQCPFPLCDLKVADEETFLYHLCDVHYLKINPNTDACKQEKDNKNRIIHWKLPRTIGKQNKKITKLLKCKQYRRICCLKSHY